MMRRIGYDEKTNERYEIWNELRDIRVYPVDYRIIIDEALDSVCCNSVWCFEVASTNGKTEEEILTTLEKGGMLFIKDARTNEVHILTREKLIGGLAKIISLNFGKELVSGNRLTTASYGFELCDKIVQMALFGKVKYKV